MKKKDKGHKLLILQVREDIALESVSTERRIEECSEKLFPQIQ
jgi:hypothetical protein